MRAVMPRLKEKLEDKDPGVQSAAVNVICELARKNPKQYLLLSPIFMRLMTKSTNNWVLIKIIKLFGCLIPHEPRLGKKIEENLKTLINNTSAMSLLYECINTLIQAKTFAPAGNDNEALIQLCVDKLRILIEDNDQNLKYLGLLSMTRILESHPKIVSQHKDIILDCLDDKDESIRLRALDLISKMVTKSTIMDITAKLLDYVRKTDNAIYRDELVSKMIDMCSQQGFAFIKNFEWYLNVLLDLTKIESKVSYGPKIATQLLEITVRVRTLREYSVAQMSHILQNLGAISVIFGRNGCIDVIRSAAVICGEFVEFVSDPKNLFLAVMNAEFGHLSVNIAAVMFQNALKILSHGLKDIENDALITDYIALFDKFLAFPNIEIQERASLAVQTLKSASTNFLLRSIHELHDGLYFNVVLGELKPVGPKAQKKVPLPNGLDLEVLIFEQSDDEEEEPEEEVEPEDDIDDAFNDYYAENNDGPGKASTSDKKLPLGKMRLNDINYLKLDDSSQKSEKPEPETDYQTILSPESDVNTVFGGIGGSEKYLPKKTKKPKKGKKVKKSKKKTTEKVSDPEDEGQVVEIMMDEEMPEGAEDTPVESDEDDDAKRLNIDVSDLLRSTRKVDDPPKLVEKKKKTKKRKKTKKLKTENAGSSDEDDLPSFTKSPSEPAEPTLITGLLPIADNVDVSVYLKFCDRNSLELIVHNKHKSRDISDLEYLSDKRDLPRSAEVAFPFSRTDDIVYKGKLLYTISSKSKSSKEKKLRFEHIITPFFNLTSWKVNDDELVDLIHEKFFEITVEQQYQTELNSLEECLYRFSGCYLVQSAQNGASICGQLVSNEEKFVMLIKINSGLVNVSLKTQSSDTSTTLQAAINSILK
ncbi:unnamed protein product [Oikopleura dioica]|uniref:AP-3 complex subunit delta domain-containing protein n=1 Tax=Oikopleura dioica TaxID=34765 RepID=E4YSJ3_OIKDI|nr:unnamed protein product [Oikopleura dioica]